MIANMADLILRMSPREPETPSQKMDLREKKSFTIQLSLVELQTEGIEERNRRNLIWFAWVLWHINH